MDQVFHVSLQLKVPEQEGRKAYTEKEIMRELKKRLKGWGEITSGDVVEREAK